MPVFCGSAVTGLGTMALINGIIDLAPAPWTPPAEMVTDDNGEPDEFVVAPGAMPAALVFKTTADQYGKYSYVKVLSGTLTPDLSLLDVTTGNTEKLGRLLCHAGQEGHGSQGTGLRRHRRHRQDGAGQDRRHPLRQPPSREV